jgi:hypothetical protein
LKTAKRDAGNTFPNSLVVLLSFVDFLRTLNFTLPRRSFDHFVLYCNSLLTKHVTHYINIMQNVLKGHDVGMILAKGKKKLRNSYPVIF